MTAMRGMLARLLRRVAFACLWGADSLDARRIERHYRVVMPSRMAARPASTNAHLTGD